MNELWMRWGLIYPPYLQTLLALDYSDTLLPMFHSASYRNKTVRPLQMVKRQISALTRLDSCIPGVQVVARS